LGGRASSLVAIFTRSSASAASKLMTTMKKVINWKTMSIMGVMSTSTVLP